jgi:phosphoribosylformimino-5-aminoimidazole carboxamide ribotide isomerase
VILYPAIDIRDGRAVRLLQGDYERETAYDADPAEAALRWGRQGAGYLHVVDLDGAREGQPVNLTAVRAITAAVDCPAQLGGGLRDAGSVAAALDAGAERVVIGTAALRDPGFLDEMIASHGERVVVAVDARGGRVSVAGWTQTSAVDAAEAVSGLTARGVRRFVFTPIEVDGTMDGPGTKQLDRVSSATDAAIIYSGGVGSLDDLRALARDCGPNVEGVIVGRALYEERFTVSEGQAALGPD